MASRLLRAKPVRELGRCRKRRKCRLDDHTFHNPGILRAGPNEITFANLTPVASFNAPPYVLLADAILDISVQATGETTTPTPVPIVPSSTAAAFTAADWSGAFYRGDGQSYGRPWSAIYGAASAYPQATIRFRLDAQPNGPATLTLTGLDDELAELNPIAIAVNDLQVFSGPSPFLNWDGVGNGADAAWTEVAVTIPADLLERGRNEITITPESQRGINAPPYVLLGDATLEAPGASVTLVTPDESRRQRDRAGGDDWWCLKPEYVNRRPCGCGACQVLNLDFDHVSRRHPPLLGHTEDDPFRRTGDDHVTRARREMAADVGTISATGKIMSSVFEFWRRSPFSQVRMASFRIGTSSAVTRYGPIGMNLSIVLPAATGWSRLQVARAKVIRSRVTEDRVQGVGC